MENITVRSGYLRNLRIVSNAMATGAAHQGG
jgi:hypothetical protein